MNKYLIALDLDDTLLNHQKEVTEKTKKCLKKRIHAYWVTAEVIV